ncbi:hypothetical protein DFH09DRAFT_372512 [Mycena vulgaris]|nr:hypothetical protein DFH09DRAFT_372512 [Mycena vulgaris]
MHSADPRRRGPRRYTGDKPVETAVGSLAGRDLTATARIRRQPPCRPCRSRIRLAPKSRHFHYLLPPAPMDRNSPQEIHLREIQSNKVRPPSLLDSQLLTFCVAGIFIWSRCAGVRRMCTLSLAPGACRRFGSYTWRGGQRRALCERRRGIRLVSGREDSVDMLSAFQRVCSCCGATRDVAARRRSSTAQRQWAPCGRPLLAGDIVCARWCSVDASPLSSLRGATWLRGGGRGVDALRARSSCAFSFYVVCARVVLGGCASCCGCYGRVAFTSGEVVDVLRAGGGATSSCARDTFPAGRRAGRLRARR